VAIKVGRVHVLREPIPLTRIQPNLRPPQNYAYLSERAFARVRAQKFR
jgi:hypothetical protein